MYIILILIMITCAVTATNISRPIQYREAIANDAEWYQHDKIICYNGTQILSTEMLLKSNDTQSDGHTLEIINCTDSKHVEKLLQENNRNKTIEIVVIRYLAESLTKETFIGIELRVLKIAYSFNDTKKVEEDFSYLENAPTLTALHVKHAYLKGLPKNNLNKMQFQNCTFSGKFDFCEKLQWLRLVQCNLSQITEDWLSVCPVQVLEIENQASQKQNRLGKVLKGILNHLKVLRINRCYLEDLDEELAGADHLQVLDLSNNQLHSVLGRTELPSLLHLDVSYNHFFSSALLASGIEKQLNLRTLKLDHNPFLNMCDYEGYLTAPYDEYKKLHAPLSGRTLSLLYLESLSITSTATDGLCFHNMRLDSLRHLDISNNTIDNLQFLGVPKTNYSVTINVTNNKIRLLPFEEDEYKILTQNVTLIGLNLTMDCECNNQWLWLALVKGLLTTSVLCREGGELMKKEKSLIACSKSSCSEDCICTVSWLTNRTSAKCDGLTSLCQLPDEVHDIYATDNKVRHLNLTCLSDTLEYLDLSGNQISRCDKWDSKLFSRRLRLARNPILCDCDNKPCVRLLQLYKHQIEDYDTLQCADGKYISAVWAANLCSVPWRGPVISAVISLATAAAAAGVLLRYRREIKIYLYARGLCSCWIAEDEIEELDFDIFLSFAHEDEELVLQKLLPELDQIYNVCVHFREWKAGEAIPVQIVSSVERSRCTLAVLSPAFLESVWALLEFRTAHMCALRDGKSKLLVVVIDDNLVRKDSEVEIPSELKAYLSTNTYLKWNDSMFWDKLAYSLPQRKHKRLSRNLNVGKGVMSLESDTKKITTGIEIDNLNLSSGTQKESFNSSTKDSISLDSENLKLSVSSSSKTLSQASDICPINPKRNSYFHDIYKENNSSDLNESTLYSSDISDAETNELSTKSIESEFMTNPNSFSSDTPKTDSETNAVNASDKIFSECTSI